MLLLNIKHAVLHDCEWNDGAEPTNSVFFLFTYSSYDLEYLLLVIWVSASFGFRVLMSKRVTPYDRRSTFHERIDEIWPHFVVHIQIVAKINWQVITQDCYVPFRWSCGAFYGPVLESHTRVSPESFVRIIQPMIYISYGSFYRKLNGEMMLKTLSQK